MSKVSKSPERNTFQKEGYLKRCAEEGKEPSEGYLKMWDDAALADEEWALAKEHSNDLEWDLRTTDWILAKARASESYAQNIYAALCNMQWCKRDTWPILSEEYCSYSWRYAGGIVADMRQKGDYIDWYCSGIQDEDARNAKAFAPEGYITDEIRKDFKRLGWVPAPGGDWENFEK